MDVDSDETFGAGKTGPQGAGREGIRPGGRSARVQASVHAAVRELLATQERGTISVPLVAARAGVTPSTIYRRWGDLQDLLADVALERMKPDGEPADTGTLRSDLVAWLEQYRDEMSSELGLAMIRDVLASQDGANLAGRCCEISRQQLGILADRAVARGEPVPDIEQMVDICLAPVVYRILFDGAQFPPAFVTGLVDRLLPAP